MTTTNHSAKGLETIERMGTQAKDWGLTPIKWEEKRVRMTVWVRCPTCRGNGHVWKFGDKVVGTNDAAQKFLGEKYPYGIERIAKEKGGIDVTCPTCPEVSWTKCGRQAYSDDQDCFYADDGNGHRSNYRTANGLVKAEREVLRWVGTVLWAKGTKFDSRFGGGRHCALCAKEIPSGRFVPVNGKDAKGEIHGMWIGEDCARKFFGVKAFKPEQMVTREDK
ncbi:MAG: hypothetical protein PHS14_00120 [Elusimicrobia bacterium]|nr:hypothetical protein [Elusimicrobiota bacterium]